MRIGHLPAEYAPAISPSWEGLPPGIRNILEGLAGGVFAIVLIAFGVGFVICAVIWAISKFVSANSRGMQAGATGLVVCVVGAILTGATWALIAWGVEQGETIGAPATTLASVLPV